jgi:hypothetical protein
MYKQRTTSNECSDQTSAESYNITDWDPKRGDTIIAIGPLASLHGHFSTISSSTHDFWRSF